MEAVTIFVVKIEFVYFLHKKKTSSGFSLILKIGPFSSKLSHVENESVYHCCRRLRFCFSGVPKLAPLDFWV